MTRRRRRAAMSRKPAMPGKRKPKFRVGQVVRLRVEGGFYFKILAIVPYGYFKFQYDVLCAGKIERYDESRLRSLRSRERGPASFRISPIPVPLLAWPSLEW